MKPFISTMGNILTSFQSGERSTFVDDAKWRRDNASWLKRSRRVAYAVMDYMQGNQFSRNDIAEKLGVSPQYISKILSGKANFSFKTISEIEEGLGIEVFQVAAMEAWHCKNRDKLPNMCFNGYIWLLIATFWHITYKMFPRVQIEYRNISSAPIH